MEVKINLFKDYADAARCEMKRLGFKGLQSVADDDQAALRLFSKLNRRIIQPRPRQVLKARDFNCPPRYENGINQLEDTLRKGQDVTPYMTRRFYNAKFNDCLLDHWGIHHFHLGSGLKDNGRLIKGTEHIVLCRIDDAQAYFITVAPHGWHIADPPWYKQELVEIIHDNWPESIATMRLHVVTGDSLDDGQVRTLRSKKGNFAPGMKDGTVYMPLGYGTAGNGSNIYDVVFADKVEYNAELIEKRIIDFYPQMREQAKLQGYRLEEPVLFSLLQASADGYWDIGDLKSGYCFRFLL